MPVTKKVKKTKKKISKREVDILDDADVSSNVGLNTDIPEQDTETLHPTEGVAPDPLGDILRNPETASRLGTELMLRNTQALELMVQTQQLIAGYLKDITSIMMSHMQLELNKYGKQ